MVLFRIFFFKKNKGLQQIKFIDLKSILVVELIVVAHTKRRELERSE
jgi:hypothetical protein